MVSLGFADSQGRKLISLQYTDSSLLTIISTRSKRRGWWNLFSVKDNEEGTERRKKGRKRTSAQTRLAV